ncbi:MAG TPA: DoxX family protein [Sphingobacteriaceae bacterium]
MKRINTFYWILTGLLLPALGFGSVMELMGNPKSVEIITSLGYPAYLSPFLGAARILALIAIFTGKFPRLKEWAYAGLVFDLIGAIYSQIAVGNPVTYTIFPIITLAIILGSYILHIKKLNIDKEDISSRSYA